MISLVILALFVVLVHYTLYWKSIDLTQLYKNNILFFGHRGLRYEFPENTIKSYLAAVNEGFKALELDIRITKDRKLICSHNVDLERETLGIGFVDNMSIQDLDNIKAGRYFAPEKQTNIPLFEEVLQKLSEKVLLNIEIKSNSMFDLAATKELVKILKTGKIKQQIIVSSFNPLVVRYIKLKTKNVPTGYIYEFARHFKGVFLARPDCLHPDAEFVDQKLIQFCKKRKIRINAWTVNNRYAKEWLMSKGVQGIITDNPQIIN